MKRICCLLFCFLLCLPPAALAQSAVPMTVAAHTHRVDFSFTMEDRQYVYVTYKAANDSGEMVLYAPNGHFEGSCALPGTNVATKMTITVSSLGGKSLLKQEVTTAADTSGRGPASGLVPPSRAAGSAREAEITAESDGVHYRFCCPGRDSVVIRCKSAQESHMVTVYAGDEYWYDGVIEMPYTYPDDSITVTVYTIRTYSELSKFTLLAPLAEYPLVEQAREGRLQGVKVCIDPGHQRQTKVETVQLGPNFTKKTTTTVGTAKGVVTNRREAVVVLEIGLQLRNALLAEGAEVIMTREDMDTFVGMIERADIPNEAGADFVLRLHCNNRRDSKIQGIQIYCPYTSSYAQAVADEDTYRTMGFTLLAAMQAATGTEAGSCTLNNTYVGNNWSKMPSFLVEMGYMSNKEEDLKMANPPYQHMLVEGMVEGIVQLAQLRGLIEE